MKYLFKRFFFLLGRILFFMVGKRMLNIYPSIRSFFYEGWMHKSFNFAGRNLFLQYPLHLFHGEYIKVGDNTFLGSHVVLQATPNYLGQNYSPLLVIGNSCNIMSHVHIAAIGKLEIGNHVTIATRVFISDAFHGKGIREEMDNDPMQRELYFKGSIVIEDYVWIGTGCVVMPGVRIGRGSIIGANSVVTRDIPPYSVVAGSPAKILRQYEA